MTTRSSVNSNGYTIPVGAVLPFLGTSKPPGFLLCDGSPYSIADYPNLASQLNGIYDVLPVTAGSFNVPNLVGYFIKGAAANTGATTPASSGTTSATFTVTEANMPPFSTNSQSFGQATGAVPSPIIYALNTNEQADSTGGNVSFSQPSSTITTSLTTTVTSATCSYTGTGTSVVEPVTISNVEPAHYALALFIRADYVF